MTLAKFSLIASLLLNATPIAAQQDETISNVLECAGSIGIENLDIDIQRGLENIFSDSQEGVEAKGAATFRNDYLKAFPKEDRLAAMQIWAKCIQDLNFQKSISSSTSRDSCIFIDSSIENPIPLHEGLCLASSEEKTFALVKRILTTSVVFSGGGSGTFSCYTDETCSFAWRDAPLFRISRRGEQFFMLKG